MSKEAYVLKVVEAAIRNEEEGERFYIEMSKKFGHHDVLGDLFKKLAGDEEAHKRRFEKIKSGIPDPGLSTRELEELKFVGPKEIESFFAREQTSDDKSASGESQTKYINTKEDALAYALEFEKSSLEYYEGMAKLLGESEELRAMIDEEKSHVRAVTRSALSLGAKFEGMDDSWNGLSS